MLEGIGSNGSSVSERHINAHTDVGVQVGGVQRLDELPQALLVAVHLPVAPDEEFPAHVCGVWSRLDLERT